MPLTALKMLTLLVVAALIALMLYAGQPTSLFWWASALPFAAWIIGPAALPYVFAKRFRMHRWAAFAMLAFLAASSAWSGYIYYEAFFVSTSSTAALAFVFVPLWQWAALGLVALSGGSAIAFRSYRRKRSARIKR